MKKACVTIHPSFQIGAISPRLFGAFLEPLGSLVDGSLYNPKHPTADHRGFRHDYIDALKTTGLPAVRMPGGNFVSGWDWKDSIGPKAQRKTQLDLAWCRYEPNDVGHDEYLQWAEEVGFDPMYTINLGTGDLKDAMHLVEYTNHEGGSYWSNLRRQYGHEKPYGVKTWYLGNEMDGPWQIGSMQKDPHGYGVLANEVAKAVKWIDPNTETVVSMSAMPSLPTYPAWDHTVLRECYGMVDYISVHHYYSAPPDDIRTQVGASESFEDVIRTRIALCDLVQAELRTPKQMMISFDEYGFMMMPPRPLHYGRGGHIDSDTFNAMIPKPPYRHCDPDDWSTLAMLPGHGTTMTDAIIMMSILFTLVRHADRIKIGCMTSGLNALATTDREHVWRSIAYYPYTQLIKHCRGISLQPSVSCDTFDIPGYAMNDFDQYDERRGVKYIESAAALNDEDGEVSVFVINRSWDHDIQVEVDASAFQGYEFIEHVELYSDDFSAVNTYEHHDTVLPHVNRESVVRNGRVTAMTKKLSWNMFRFGRK